MAARCRDKAGNLPLHVLLCQEDPNPQLVLVVLQANSSAARVRSSIGSYPLFQACRLPKAHPSIIKMLLQSYPESIHCKVYGSTPLHALTHAGCTNAESLRVLLALNSDLAAQVNNTGNLPLHYVAANVESVGSSDCVRLLLSAYPAGATVRNKSGQTPVQRVQSRWDHTSILSELTLSLRLLLRYVPPVKLVTQEQTDLYQLNWLCRRDIVMARCMANQKCLQNSVLVDVCAVKDNVGIEDQESDNIISRDMQVFSNIVMRLDCEEIWRHIVSYI